MCYFAITDYSCGDWKWGNMMERCPRQHRIGETCGAKLIHQDHVTKNPDTCKICQDIEVKRRRLVKVEDSIRRWTPEKEKFAASLDKARCERDDLIERIKTLYSRRQSVMFRQGGDRSQQASSSADQGGSNVLAPSRGNSYTYSSQGQGYSASGQMSAGYPPIGTFQPGLSPTEDYALPANRRTPYSSRR